LFAAGEGWSYTDTGYILLGMIIEKVSGHSYYEEVGSRFLTPLNLKLTSPSDRRDLPGLAAGYMSDDNPFRLPAKTLREDGGMVWHPAVEWTGGGLISNSHDLVVWAKALFEGEAMDGPYLDELLSGEPISNETPHVRFGAGVAIRDAGPIGAWYSHSGWIPGYTSSLRYYPDHRAAIAFQINTDVGIVDDSTDLFKEMAERLEQVIAAVAGD
ncbi:MAG: serine hydrolase domain-containing protein, partial [Thiogranum sp.]